MNKAIVTAIIVVIVAASGAFYGGMRYERNKENSGKMAFRSGDGQFQSAPGQGGQRGQTRGSQGFARNGGAFENGEVTSKDDRSITIQTRDGSSKIVYFSEKTSVGKTVDGLSSDLEVGQQVMVSGEADSTSGAITAQNIQIRPDVPMNQNQQN